MLAISRPTFFLSPLLFMATERFNLFGVVTHVSRVSRVPHSLLFLLLVPYILDCTDCRDLNSINSKKESTLCASEFDSTDLPHCSHRQSLPLHIYFVCLLKKINIQILFRGTCVTCEYMLVCLILAYSYIDFNLNKYYDFYDCCKDRSRMNIEYCICVCGIIYAIFTPCSTFSFFVFLSYLQVPWHRYIAIHFHQTYALTSVPALFCVRCKMSACTLFCFLFCSL